jgi:serine/threonine protein phosphatase PrpC
MLVLALGDGAGSSEISQLGSRLAVRSIADLALKYASLLVSCADEVAVTLLFELFERTATRLERLAERADLPLSALATTLSCALITQRIWVCARVGDSPAIIADHSTELRTVARTTPSEYVNETTFLLGDAWRSEISIETGPSADVDGIVLMSDGLAFCAIDLAADEPSHGFFDPLLGAVRSGQASPAVLSSILDSSEARSRSEDDKSIAIAVRIN